MLCGKGGLHVLSFFADTAFRQGSTYENYGVSNALE